MNTKTGLVATFCLLINIWLNGQVAQLDKAGFSKNVLDQWWSTENKSGKSDCDMRIFVIKSAGFELNCINWTAGFSGNKCGYDLKLSENFIELKPRDCAENADPGYIYCYLTDTQQLCMLLRKKQMPLNTALLKEKDWIRFDKIKR